MSKSFALKAGILSLLICGGYILLNYNLFNSSLNSLIVGINNGVSSLEASEIHGIILNIGTPLISGLISIYCFIWFVIRLIIKEGDDNKSVDSVETGFRD